MKPADEKPVGSVPTAVEALPGVGPTWPPHASSAGSVPALSQAPYRPCPSSAMPTSGEWTLTEDGDAAALGLYSQRKSTARGCPCATKVGAAH